MTIHITCQCGKQLHAPDEFAGRQTRCPQCKQPVMLPGPAAAIQPAAVPPVPPPAQEAVMQLEPVPMSEASPAAGTSKQAIVSLVLGVLSFCLPVLLGVPAIIFGFLALSSVKKSGGQLGGKGMAIAGLVLGFVTMPMCCVGVGYAFVSSMKDSANRVSTVNSLRQIGLAIHTYHDATNTFPGEGNASPTQSRLSWRVQILPNIEEMALYQRFHQDEPWDSPHNMSLLSQMPKMYLDRRFQTDADRAKGLTYFRGFVVQDSVFGTPNLSLQKITNANGMANTIMVVEAGDPVPWTKPEDPSFNGDSPMGGPDRGDFLILYADGHVSTAKRNVDRKMIRSLIRWNNTEAYVAP
jgi:hypothetical protein